MCSGFIISILFIYPLCIYIITTIHGAHKRNVGGIPCLEQILYFLKVRQSRKKEQKEIEQYNIKFYMLTFHVKSNLCKKQNSHISLRHHKFNMYISHICFVCMYLSWKLHDWDDLFSSITFPYLLRQSLSGTRCSLSWSALVSQGEFPLFCPL